MSIPLTDLWTAVLYGILLASSLLIGAVIGVRSRVPQRVVGASLAFSAGALIGAIGLELIFVPFTHVGANWVIVGAAAGAFVFAAIDITLVRETGRSGWGLLGEQATEGLPESLAVGASAGAAGIALLASVALSNIPEAMSGAVEMKEQKISGGKAVLAWAGTGLLLLAATMGGYLLSSFMGEGPTAVLHAVAGGAALAGVSSEMAPAAYERAGLLVTLATVLGFLTAFWLFSLSYSPA